MDKENIFSTLDTPYNFAKFYLSDNYMTFTTIESTRQGPIALIGLNRPDKLNAINATMIDEINAALDQIEADESVLAIVVHGHGRAFSAGFDLQAGVAAKRETEADWQAAIDVDLELIMRFWHSPKPTVAALQGYVLAGGFEIALACDMSVCDSSALFGEPEVRFGSSIVALLLPWYVNPKRAKRMLLSGQDRMTADEALRFGIVNEVVAEGEALSAGLALASEVALMDPDSVRMTKQAINQSYEIMGLSQALRMGADTSVKIETLETDLRRQFNQVLREQGMKAALAWREARLNQDG
jgi:enoyl-CoA hydratase